MLRAIRPTLSSRYAFLKFFMFSLILVFNSHLPQTDKKRTEELQCTSVPKFNPRTPETKSLLPHEVNSLVKQSGEVHKQTASSSQVFADNHEP